MRRAYALPVLFLLTAAGLWAGPRIIAPPTVTRGTAFSVAIHPVSEAASVRFKLIDPEGRLALDVPGFRIEGARDIEVWVACLATESTAPVGEYQLEVVPDGAAAVTVPVTVEDRSFTHEDIPLNAALTDLRATPDPRKVAEAREILAILARHDVGGQYWFGRFSMPVQGARVTSGFGDRRRYLYTGGEVAHAIHYGLDLALPTGSPVHSDGSGLVMFAGPRIVSGNTVVVEHLPGVYSLYYHLHEIDVKAGERIETGTLIGKVGMTGLATGPHLHWEIRVDGIPVDPDALMARPLVDKEAIFATILDEPVPVAAEAASVPGR
ncbi:M23 family metallopeptidase [Salinispira pacifica]